MQAAGLEPNALWFETIESTPHVAYPAAIVMIPIGSRLGAYQITSGGVEWGEVYRAPDNELVYRRSATRSSEVDFSYQPNSEGSLSVECFFERERAAEIVGHRG